MNNSDQLLFPILEVLLLTLCALAWWKVNQGKIGGIKRGSKALAIFHQTYVAVTFLLVLVTLNVDQAAGHRVFFVVLNVAITFYLCIANAWFRNKIIRVIVWVTEVEE